MELIVFRGFTAGWFVRAQVLRALKVLVPLRLGLALAILSLTPVCLLLLHLLLLLVLLYLLLVLKVCLLRLQLLPPLLQLFPYLLSLGESGLLRLFIVLLVIV